MKKFIDWIEEKLAHFYTRISLNTQIPDKALSFYRIVIGIFFLKYIPSYNWLAGVPSGFFRPHVLTPAKLFNSLPPSWYFQVIDYIIILLLFLLIFGIKTRIAAILLFFLIVVNNSFFFSFGKIDHNIMTALIFLYLGFTNAGTKYALNPDKKISTQKIATAIFGISMVFAFFTAGYEKALRWVDFDLSTSGFLSWFYSTYFTLGRDELLADIVFNFPTWFTETMDYTAVIFEITGIIFIFLNRKSWHLYLLLASLFHLINTLILNISFTPHVIVYGLWLLSPFFQQRKLFILAFILVIFMGFYINGLYFTVGLWLLTLSIGIYCWQKGYYFLKTGRLKETTS